MIAWRKSSFSNGASACVEVGRWVTSSYSQGNGNCVAVAGAQDGDILVRDTKLGDASPVLRFTSAEFDAWVKGCAAGEFDL
jgi:hypothetical protein